MLLQCVQKILSAFHSNKKLCVLEDYIDFLANLWYNLM
nr:MAG TPA: hypothetical protein [Caudoviricetes sp.]